jgi:hypothetical protein
MLSDNTIQPSLQKGNPPSKYHWMGQLPICGYISNRWATAFNTCGQMARNRWAKKLTPLILYLHKKYGKAEMPTFMGKTLRKQEKRPITL